MARQARELSETGLYHIVFRGINRQGIFEEEQDYLKIIEILSSLKDEMGFEIYVYCLMTNHAHLLIKEKEYGDITTIMKRLLTKYARWFNIKYGRSGALIANRYKSEVVDIDSYFLCVVRYIHQNPLKAGMVADLSEYKWSSYLDYSRGRRGITDTKFVLGMLPKSEFAEFHRHSESEVFLVSDRVKKTDEAIRREIIDEMGMDPLQIGTLEKKERNRLLIRLKDKYSIRQIERVTGISRGVICRVNKKT